MTQTVVAESPTLTLHSQRGTATRVTLWWVGGIAVLAIIGIASVAFGSLDVTPSAMFRALGGSTETIAEAAVAKRIPRTVLAMLVGAALALSGALMQAVTRNPLADPGILGVSSGASLAVVVGIAFFGLSGAMRL